MLNLTYLISYSNLTTSYLNEFMVATMKPLSSQALVPLFSTVDLLSSICHCRSSCFYSCWILSVFWGFCQSLLSAIPPTLVRIFCFALSICCCRLSSFLEKLTSVWDSVSHSLHLWILLVQFLQELSSNAYLLFWVPGLVLSQSHLWYLSLWMKVMG